MPDSIFEGYSAYFYTARCEATETQNHPRKMEEEDHISRNVVNDLVSEYEGLIRGINAYISYVQRRRDKESPDNLRFLLGVLIT